MSSLIQERKKDVEIRGCVATCRPETSAPGLLYCHTNARGHLSLRNYLLKKSKIFVVTEKRESNMYFFIIIFWAYVLNDVAGVVNLHKI